jgi:hypothetical protein
MLMMARSAAGRSGGLRFPWRRALSTGTGSGPGTGMGWFESLVPVRDSLPDVRGLPVVTSSWQCLEQLDLAVWEHARWTGRGLHHAREALKEDYDCPLAHSMLALHQLSRGGAAATHPEVIASLRQTRKLLDAGCGEDREMVPSPVVQCPRFATHRLPPAALRPPGACGRHRGMGGR